MKNKYLIILLLSTWMTSFISCTDMNDKVDKYLKGQTIYAGKVDSIVVQPGFHRLKLNFYVSAQRIDYLRVYWNNYKDSIDISIKNQSGKFSTILTNLEEQNYLFNVYSYDQYGNKSLVTEASGTSYGSTYQIDLTNRDYFPVYSYFDPSTSKMTIYWKPQYSEIYKTFATYTNTDGKKISVEIPASDNISTLENVKSDLKITSYYQPASNTIDTIAPTESRSIPIYYESRIDRTSWSILAYSSRYSSSYPVEKVIDGDATTAWRAKRNTNPNYFIIDMGRDINISRFGLYKWNSTSDTYAYPNVSLYYAAEGTLSDPTKADDSGWKKYGDTSLNLLTYEQFYRGDLAKARYIMFYAPAGNSQGYFNLGEIYAYSPTIESYIK